MVIEDVVMLFVVLWLSDDRMFVFVVELLIRLRLLNWVVLIIDVICFFRVVMLVFSLLWLMLFFCVVMILFFILVSRLVIVFDVCVVIEMVDLLSDKLFEIVLKLVIFDFMIFEIV